MRAYKFLDEKYGLKSLSEKRLKISTIGDLNDPFELVPFNLSDRNHRWAARRSRQEFAQKRGMICLSLTWRDPVLWAHYSDKHRGICLGFDLPDNNEICKSVRYVSERLPFPENVTMDDTHIAEALLYTKYSSWSYEKEVRIFAALNEKDGDFYFKEFDGALKLATVVVGARCPVTKAQIKAALGQVSKDVELIKARPGFTKFEVVKDERGLK